MKNILLVCFIAMISCAFGQENTANGDTLKMKIIGVNDSLGLQIVKYSSFPFIETENNLSNYYLRWNNNQDSILFFSNTFSLSSLSHFERSLGFGFYLSDTTFITLKQLDNKGNPEVIIKHNIYRTTITTIVNIDSGTIMFHSTNANSVTYFLGTSYGSDFNNYDECSYAYEISFDNDHHLIIHDLVLKGGLNPLKVSRDGRTVKGKRDYLFMGCHPDKKEGVYILENGIYTYSEEKSKELKKQQ